MRTTRQWLEKAKEDGYYWSADAIKNYDPDYCDDNTSDTLSDALNNAFDWQDSPEGKYFWDKIHKNLVNEEAFDATFTDTISELITKYENTKTKLDTLQPDTSLREPFRQAAFKVYKNSYTNEVEELAQQIAERIGFSDKYEDLRKEFDACKKTSEEVHNLYINEVKKNSESISIISQLEKEIEFLKNRKLIGWITADADEAIYSHGNIEKGDEHWMLFSKELTSKEAIALCGRIPEWDDEEPIPIYK